MAGWKVHDLQMYSMYFLLENGDFHLYSHVSLLEPKTNLHHMSAGFEARSWEGIFQDSLHRTFFDFGSKLGSLNQPFLRNKTYQTLQNLLQNLCDGIGPLHDGTMFGQDGCPWKGGAVWGVWLWWWGRGFPLPMLSPGYGSASKWSVWGTWFWDTPVLGTYFWK